MTVLCWMRCYFYRILVRMKVLRVFLVLASLQILCNVLIFAASKEFYCCELEFRLAEASSTPFFCYFLIITRQRDQNYLLCFVLELVWCLWWQKQHLHLKSWRVPVDLFPVCENKFIITADIKGNRNTDIFIVAWTLWDSHCISISQACRHKQHLFWQQTYFMVYSV